MLSNNLLIRYKKPGRFDRAPFNTLCQVIGDENSKDSWYIQLEKERDAAAWWMEIGDMLIAMYIKEFTEEKSREKIIETFLNTRI